jgi:large subunit ribosomal protein L4
MKAALFNQKGKKLEDLELNDAVFGDRVNQKLLSQYVHVYLNNQRAGTADTKDRGEVSGGGRKPWRQKGTGNARAGSTRSPIWRKGGVTFGPLSTRNWKKTINRKMRQGAIRSAFSLLAKNGGVSVVDSLEFKGDQLTQQAADFLNSLNLSKKVLVVLPAKQVDVINAFKNLPNAKTVLVSELNAYDLISTKQVVIVQPSLDYVNQNWAK